MSKDAKQYPVATAYGCVRGYPLHPCKPGYGFHMGIDYGCPVGTPVIVNGVQIGLSGATGYVTGPHLHVGRWVNGQSTNPVGGFSFKSAVVTQVASDGTNGNYVRVQADGASWVYLHLSKQTCKVGQKLVAPAPAPAYPKWVRVTGRGGAYVRSKPTTASPLAGSRYLPYLTPFRVAGVVTGQSVNGSNKWFKSMYGNYIWAGNAR